MLFVSCERGGAVRLPGSVVAAATASGRGVERLHGAKDFPVFSEMAASRTQPQPRHQRQQQQQTQQQQQQQQQESQQQQQQQQQPQQQQRVVGERQRLCTNCRNHGLSKVWKKHKRYCNYRDCPCARCMKTAATRKNCAEQTAKRRARQEDELREQELRRNPENFKNERPVPYPVPVKHGDVGAGSGSGPMSVCSSSTGGGPMSTCGRLSRASLAEASSTVKQSSSRTSDYDDSQSTIDIGDSGGDVGDGMPVEQSCAGDMDVDASITVGVIRAATVDIDAGKHRYIYICIRPTEWRIGKYIYLFKKKISKNKIITNKKLSIIYT